MTLKTKSKIHFKTIVCKCDDYYGIEE